MTHPLDFNPRRILAERRQADRETVATVAKTVAAESPSGEDCSNNRNFSGGPNMAQRSLELEEELSRVREVYALCIDFERKPFPRKLSRSCIAAGYQALREMEAKMAELEGEIRRLKESN